MGLYDQKTSTSIPDVSPQEQEYLDLMNNVFMPAYLDELGYDVETSQTVFEDSDIYKSLTQQIEAEKLNPTPNNSSSPLSMTRLQRLENELESERASFQPSTSYDVEKRESAELEYLKKQYGADSQQYLDARDAEELANVNAEKDRKAIYNTFQEKTLKFLNGDFSITQEQKDLIQERMAPVKAGIENLYQNSMEETMAAYGDFSKVAGENGMTVADQFGAVGAQIIATGNSMKEAISNVVSTRTALLEQGIYDATGEITKQVSVKAASMGRDPSDPEFTADINEIVAQQTKIGQLELGAMEANLRMGVEERTGSGLEGVLQNQAEKRFQLAQQRGSALIGVEENIANQEYQMGGGNMPAMLGAGSTGYQFGEAVVNQRLANAGSAMNAPQNMFGMYSPERFAEGTTTQHGNFGDWMDGITGVASGAMSAYSGISQASYLNSLTDGGG